MSQPQKTYYCFSGMSENFDQCETCPIYERCQGHLSGQVIETIDPDGSRWIDLPGERVALK